MANMNARMHCDSWIVVATRFSKSLASITLAKISPLPLHFIRWFRKQHSSKPIYPVLNRVDPSRSLKEKMVEGRTRLHNAVIAGNADKLREIVEKEPVLLNKTDTQGDTALHLAVRKYRVDMVRQLVDLEPNLCDCAYNVWESPLNMAARFGFLEAVKILMNDEAYAVQTCKDENVLHLVVKLNQVKIVSYLAREKPALLQELINLPYDLKEKGPITTSYGEGNGDTATRDGQPLVGVGDTPLHVAARNKYEHMVNLLPKVPGVNKNACNREGKTPLDIAREVTEYYESFRIIGKLTDDLPKRKSFMYCAPHVSHGKYKRAREMVNKSFDERRNAELVVAVLLATMTFTAVFTVPGGFETETQRLEELGSPILIAFTSFKLFLIFDCVAFFLSLFVCIMWQMSSELTTGDKMLFMTINGFVVCCSFGFTAYGFMTAVYTVLARKVKTLSWVVLGNLIAITACGVLAFIYQSIKFTVARARFHRLCGVPWIADDVYEYVWNRAEGWELLNLSRKSIEACYNLITGQADIRGLSLGRCKGGGGCNDHSSSPAMLLNQGNARQSVSDIALQPSQVELH